MSNILLFDIESSSLSADNGFVICASWKKLGEKEINTVRIDQFTDVFSKDCTNDFFVVKKLSEALSEADMWITWYGSRFDVPLIQAKLIYYGLPVMPPVPHVDGWRIAKYKMKLRNNRLATVSSFLEVEEKTPLTPKVWVRASAGHVPSIDYIVEHCEQDVQVLEQVYEKIRPLETNHPNVALFTAGKQAACPRCGTEGRLQHRGWSVAKATKKRRYQCQSCGAWSTGKPEKVEVDAR